ncbi:RsmB/NOP family class I SAM-dependent RNA methyltransferase [Candidatus Woesearchaeota archaeon]|nr:RsmB/NOP family class I SAM-dependent RNA methyltransferase [Candidatus Woesearchaeota archaeon]
MSSSSPSRSMIKDVFRERFLELLGSEEEYERFVETILRPQRKSFRVNSLKVEDEKALVEGIASKGLCVQRVPWCEGAYFVEYQEGTRTDLGNLFEHFLGQIYVQEATSLLPPLVLDVPENVGDDFRVLDVAAAPGSKTTQLGALMKGKGIIVANELDYKRLGPLKLNLERSGLCNIVITHGDGTRIEGEEVYDRIMLDAPCSGSGVIRKSPGTLKVYNPKRLRQVQHLQLKLLRRAFALLKKGGILVYSTCSLDPEENELCIQKFLEEEKGVELLDAKIPNIVLSHKVKSFGGVDVLPEISECTMRVWPQDNDTNGFFVAKLRKVEE